MPRSNATRSLFAVGLLALLSGPAVAGAGKIVVANDEWTLSNTGFASAPDTPRYVANVTDWFTGGGAGNFLAYSDNFGLTESSLATTMSNLGHGWTVSTTITFDLGTLQQFDAVFLCGFRASTTVLDDYVQGGGHVYIAAGSKGSGEDALLWNPLLKRYGLALSTPTNHRQGTIAIDLNHPLFHGVSGLYQNNGNDPVDLDDNDCTQRILWSDAGNDLYAVSNNGAAIELHTYSPTYMAGDFLQITTGMGLADKRLVIVAEAVNGVDVFVQIVLTRFGPDCRWDMEATIPSGLAGLDVTLASYGIGFSGKIEASNYLTVSFL